MQSIGFKEWAVVCQALGEGRQRAIVRKGGIAEGCNGFAFRYPEFFLFPTFFHEQLSRVRLPSAVLPIPPSDIEIQFLVRVKEARVMTDWEEVRALEALHILQESVVRERFEYDEAPGVHVAFVDVFRLDHVWRFPDSKTFGGCRSWVPLRDPPRDLQLHPVQTT